MSEIRIEDTRDAFREWVGGQESLSSLTSCPLEQYLTAKGAENAAVSDFDYANHTLDGWVDLPNWAARFVTEVDSHFHVTNEGWFLRGEDAVRLLDIDSIAGEDFDV